MPISEEVRRLRSERMRKNNPMKRKEVRDKRKRRVNHVCIVCGKKFELKRSSILSGKYCSHLCYLKDCRSPNIEKKCVGCGKLFTVKSYDPQKFCKRKCMDTHSPSKGRKLSEDAKKRISNANRGRTSWCKGLTKETDVCLNQISQKLKNGSHWKYKGYKPWNKNVTGYHTVIPEEGRKNIARAIRKRCKDQKYREKISKHVKKSYVEHPELRKKRADFLKNPKNRKRLLTGLIKKPNKKEKMLFDLIKEKNLPFKYVGDGKCIIADKCPDFIHTKGKRKLIELFGDYWHNPSEVEPRVELFKEHDYGCLVIWEHELKNLGKIYLKIKNFLIEPLNVSVKS